MRRNFENDRSAVATVTPTGAWSMQGSYNFVNVEVSAALSTISRWAIEVLHRWQLGNFWLERRCKCYHLLLVLEMHHLDQWRIRSVKLWQCAYDTMSCSGMDDKTCISYNYVVKIFLGLTYTRAPPTLAGPPALQGLQGRLLRHWTAFSKGWLRRKQLWVLVCLECREENSPFSGQQHQVQFGLNPALGVVYDSLYLSETDLGLDIAFIHHKGRNIQQNK